MGCTCYPYKDSLVIVSQSLSVVAFILSIGWMPSFFFGLCAMIMHQALCCCPVQQPFFWILAGISTGAAALNFYAAPEMMNRVTPDFCWPILTLDLMCNDARTFFGISHYVSGSLWLVLAILNVVFVNSGRHATWNDKYFADNNHEIEAVAVPVSQDNNTDV